MSLLLEAPVSAAPVAPPRRRPGLLVLAAACLVAGLVVSASSFAPRTAAFSDATPTASGAPFVTVAEFGLRGAYVLGYAHNRAVTLAVSVRNDGPLPVKVGSADIPGGRVPLLEITSVDGLPLALGAGESGSLVLHGRLGNCRWYHERALETYAGVTVGFTSLGWSGSRVIGFDRPILVKSPMLASCPDRKLNRQADRRSLLG